MLDPAGVTRTKALGSERMARKLRDALPGGDGALRAAVWEFMRPMLSPALVALNRDAFVIDESVETTVDLDGHRAASDLDELALDDEPETRPHRSLGPSARSSRPMTGSGGARCVPIEPRLLFFGGRTVDPARAVGEDVEDAARDGRRWLDRISLWSRSREGGR